MILFNLEWRAFYRAIVALQYFSKYVQIIDWLDGFTRGTFSFNGKKIECFPMIQINTARYSTELNITISYGDFRFENFSQHKTMMKFYMKILIIWWPK